MAFSGENIGGDIRYSSRLQQHTCRYVPSTYKSGGFELRQKHRKSNTKTILMFDLFKCLLFYLGTDLHDSFTLMLTSYSVAHGKISFGTELYGRTS